MTQFTTKEEALKAVNASMRDRQAAWVAYRKSPELFLPQRVSVYCFTCGGQFDTDCDETYCSLSCEDMADAMDEAEEDEA